MKVLITKKCLYLPILTPLLLLSLNPTESGESFLSLYLRVLPFLFFLVLFFLINPDVKFSSAGLGGVLLFCVLILVFKFDEQSKRLLLHLASIVGMYFLAVAVDRVRAAKELFLNILNLIIVVWMVSLFAQFFSYYLLGLSLDVHNLVFPFSESRGISNQDSVRFGGLQIEPGTYSNWMFGVVVLRSFLMKKISARLNWVAVGSTLMTLSFWAYISAGFFVVAAFLELKSSQRIKLAIALFFIALLTYFFISEEIIAYLLTRAELNTPSATGKLEVYSYMLTHYEEWVLIGSGFKTAPCIGCLSWQDAGVGVNMLFYFGIVMLPIMILILFKAVYSFGVKGALLVVPLFIAKYYYWDPIFIVLVMIFLVHSARSGLVKNNFR